MAEGAIKKHDVPSLVWPPIVKRFVLAQLVGNDFVGSNGLCAGGVTVGSSR